MSHPVWVLKTELGSSGWVCGHAAAHAETRGQLAGLSSLLSPHGAQELNSSCQASGLVAVPFPAGPSCWLLTANHCLLGFLLFESTLLLLLDSSYSWCWILEFFWPQQKTQLQSFQICQNIFIFHMWVYMFSFVSMCMCTYVYCVWSSEVEFGSSSIAPCLTHGGKLGSHTQSSLPIRLVWLTSLLQGNLCLTFWALELQC